MGTENPAGPFRALILGLAVGMKVVGWAGSDEKGRTGNTSEGQTPGPQQRCVRGTFVSVPRVMTLSVDLNEIVGYVRDLSQWFSAAAAL